MACPIRDTATNCRSGQQVAAKPSVAATGWELEKERF
jgi:hypothetical protein